jgi:hypothetical protein
VARPVLKSFRELRVSDPVLRKDSSTSAYTFVDRKGKTTELGLHYKFDAPLYAGAAEGKDWTMRNQARLHHSIPSLNYGLFCDRVVFDFPLTGADLAYHRHMQDATAREQYLTRFVRDEPHPLILPAYHVAPADFEPEAVKDLADIVAPVEDPRPAERPAPDPRRYVVLSSGGKESLLTYGLLKELGRDVSPVYVNESGRHWHTALLSYRHHERTEPRTRRVWTSVDRLYVGANRILPCVRPDFQRVGADVYPIQLFTFNSYQMAVAGLAMHEGVGTMLMGNEFDEGPWPEVKGVRHWHAIYDQSQEFDVVLNRYFAGKGWGVTQTSLLRTLSSLVIEDLLASRYPDLLRTQTSCHATHMAEAGSGTASREGAPAKVPAPCGRCSKCLGVLLFLLAGGHDPTLLRYAKEDVDGLGERVAQTHLKVDQPEAEHAMWLAARNGGFRFRGSPNGYLPREHAEVQAIRFHPEMSRRDAMPAELAREAYALFATRTNGALEKRGEAWVPTTP